VSGELPLSDPFHRTRASTCMWLWTGAIGTIIRTARACHHGAAQATRPSPPPLNRSSWLDSPMRVRSACRLRDVILVALRTQAGRLVSAGGYHGRNNQL